MFGKHSHYSVIAVFAALVFGFASSASAHCDGLDGPVVMAARQALESGDINPVLIWVGEDDEQEIRAAFNETLTVRALGEDAKALADRFFFETLVRVHRAGEGAPFTGLKPAGRDLGPAIPAADLALQSGSVKALDRLLRDRMRRELDAKFEAAIERKDFASDNTAGGREYIAAYVDFIHFVERLYEAVDQPAHGHYPDDAH